MRKRVIRDGKESAKNKRKNIKIEKKKEIANVDAEKRGTGVRGLRRIRRRTNAPTRRTEPLSASLLSVHRAHCALLRSSARLSTRK